MFRPFLRYKKLGNANESAYYQWTKRCEQTAATELVNSGVGVGTVRQLLGHRNLQTTQCYAELSGETVRHELDAFARRKTRTR